MDAYSSSSKYHADVWIYGCALLISPTHFFLFVFLRVLCSPFPRFLPLTAKKLRVQPGCIPLLEKLWSQDTEKLQVNNLRMFFFSSFIHCEDTHTHARMQRLGKVIRASRWWSGGGRKKGGPTSCGESGERR